MQRLIEQWGPTLAVGVAVFVAAFVLTPRIVGGQPAVTRIPVVAAVDDASRGEADPPTLGAAAPLPTLERVRTRTAVKHRKRRKARSVAVKVRAPAAAPVVRTPVVVRIPAPAAVPTAPVSRPAPRPVAQPKPQPKPAPAPTFDSAGSFDSTG
jgi:hypothetical protein